MKGTIYTVFEHDNLFEEGDLSKEEDLSKKELEALCRELNGKLGGQVFQRRWDKVYVRHYVGVLATDKLFLQILPKMYQSGLKEGERVAQASKNLLHMLSYTRNLKFIDVGTAPLKIEGGFYEVFVYLFAKNLLNLLERNFVRDYEAREEKLSFIRGKILFSKQSCQFLNDRVWCRYFNYDHDVLMHRILKYVCYLLTFAVQYEDTKTFLKRILSIYDMVELSPVNISDFQKLKFTRLNGEYEPFISFAKLFLESKTLELQGGVIKGFSMLFDMNKLFEEYIGRLLENNWSNISQDIGGLKGSSVYLQRSERKLYGEVNLIPDILVKDGNGKTLMVMDTKYRELGVAEEDVDYEGGSPKGDLKPAPQEFYQMFAYSKAYECKDAVLIYPATDSTLRETKIIGSFGGSNSEERLHVVTVNLMRDLRSEETRLIEELGGVIKGIFKEGE